VFPHHLPMLFENKILEQKGKKGGAS